MDRETLRRVQQNLLEIAKEIKRVCEANDIPYFLYRGTFLGAVRHKGFIPWDDDMDFAMLRADYERFCRIAPRQLGEGFVFQHWNAGDTHAHPFGKVRKKGTRYVEAKCAVQEENGFYVDIYPLDYAPQTQEQRDALSRRLLHLYRTMLMKCRYTPWKEGEHTVLYKRLGYVAYQAASVLVSHKKLVELYETPVLAVCPGDTLYEQSGLPTTYYFDAEDYAQWEQYPFEDTTFPGPRNFDKVLSSLYGDYMTPPPEDKRENRHQITEISFGDEN